MSGCQPCNLAGDIVSWIRSTTVFKYSLAGYMDTVRKLHNECKLGDKCTCGHIIPDFSGRQVTLKDGVEEVGAKTK